MVNKLIENDLEGSGKDRIQILSQQFTEGTLENHKKGSKRIAGISEENLIRHLRRTNEKRNHYINLLGDE
jgi:hypothetical protein